MKIAHISIGSPPSLLSPFGGAIQRRVLELSMAQARVGHQVTAFSMGETQGTIQHEGVTIHFVACRGSSPWRRLEYQTRVLARMWQTRTEPPDVLHVHSEPESLLTARLLRVPAVLSYDNFVFGRGHKTPLFGLYRRMLERFDMLLPCSKYCAEESSAYWGFRRGYVAVLPNGVNSAQFVPDLAAGRMEREQLALGDRPVILYVGRVCEQKGTDILLAAYEELRTRFETAALVIAGPIGQFSYRRRAPDEQWWRQRMRQAGALYLGGIEEERLTGIYNMADVFVMPTRDQEMFGMAAVEAQACGLPVVASDHGGLRETVPEHCGARFPVGDYEALAGHVERLLRSPTLRARCGEAARNNACRYEWGTIVESLDRLYGRVVDLGRGVRGNTRRPRRALRK